jgi:hypothetical protein
MKSRRHVESGGAKWPQSDHFKYCTLTIQKTSLYCNVYLSEIGEASQTHTSPPPSPESATSIPATDGMCAAQATGAPLYLAVAVCIALTEKGQTGKHCTEAAVLSYYRPLGHTRSLLGALRHQRW